MKLGAASSIMTTFYIPFGWCKFSGMPFWLRLSQDIFQRKIDQIYENCWGALGIADDLQVFVNDKTHDRNLHEAMDCIRKQALNLILINKLLRLNAVVSLVTCSLQRESMLTKEGRSHQTYGNTHQ